MISQNKQKFFLQMKGKVDNYAKWKILKKKIF